LVPKEESEREKTRQSVVFFVWPNGDSVAKPIHGQEPKLPRYNEGNTAAEHLTKRLAKIVPKM
jgi:isopenicillin N synthase-like dioxygenase